MFFIYSIIMLCKQAFKEDHMMEKLDKSEQLDSAKMYGILI